MIDACAQDLLTRIGAIPSLTGRVGFALGGSLPDPGAVKIQVPALWLLHAGLKNTRDTASNLPAPQLIAMLMFAGVLYIAPTEQISTQLPLLQSVIKAVQGQLSPTGERWFVSSGKLLSFNVDRLSYELIFCVNATV